MLIVWALSRTPLTEVRVDPPKSSPKMAWVRMEESWFLAVLWAGGPLQPSRKLSLGPGGHSGAYGRQSPPSQEPREPAGPSLDMPQLLFTIADRHAPDTERLRNGDTRQPWPTPHRAHGGRAGRATLPGWGSIFSLPGHPDPASGAHGRLLP